MLKMRSFETLVLALSLAAAVNTQGEPCDTPDNAQGTCIPLPRCTYLVQLYNSDRSRNTINFLVASQRNCGNRAEGRNPLLCCKNDAQQITQPPPTIPTTTAPVVNSGDCRTPDGIDGDCTGIRQCQSVLDTFKQRQKDPEYVKFIRQSNANCNYASQVICCPRNAPQTPPQEQITEETHVASRSRLLLPSEGCGFTKVPHNRVVGGVPARKGGWPWIALVGYKSSIGEVSFKCGGSIISNRHVLTAAHCIRKDLSSVRLGEHDLSTDTETTHIDIPVSQVIQHPEYDKKDGHADLTILVLDGEIPFSSLISPICIPHVEPQRSKSFVGFQPFVAGWGRTQEGGKSANILQEVQLPVVSNQQCRQNYNVINKVVSERQFDDAVMCAGYKDGKRDSCQGDSGGPLMIPITTNDNFYYYQIGVVSYGIGCARAEVPGVYTKVQHFADWIKQIVETT